SHDSRPRRARRVDPGGNCRAIESLVTLPDVNFASVLLAAGASRRFGRDKLLAQLDGRSLLDRSAAALAAAGCRWNIAVTRPDAPDRADILSERGYSLVANDNADAGIAASIARGIQHAQDLGAGGVVIALADMPFIPSAHFNALMETACAAPAGLSYSLSGDVRSAPAAFLASWFPRLAALEGDRGAGEILKAADAACAVCIAPGDFLDIDAPSDLERL
ncbi:nucleotidyltransferase family protein, partial [Hyphococcus sp.]|uniref:nucleotidyltransferase family protein n=1 Tax=Hyphococcus sp. TaxID=2038636 RepID=UPI0035C7143E